MIQLIKLHIFHYIIILFEVSRLHMLHVTLASPTKGLGMIWNQLDSPNVPRNGHLFEKLIANNANLAI